MMDEQTRHRFMRAVYIEQSATRYLKQAVETGNRRLATRAAPLVMAAHQRAETLSRGSVSIYTER